MTAINEIIGRQIAWNRLIAVVEEQAQTLIRIAFSTTVREAGDLSAGVFDCAGRMLAQAVTGTPGHVNAMAAAVGHVLAKFPLAGMRPGDAYITNDPWRGTGHLNDFTVVTPVFHGEIAVALVASTSHVVDIGGLGFGTDASSIYEEGLFIPILPFTRGGVVDRTLIDIILANVRYPREVEGDLHALAACNSVCASRLIALLDELAMPDFEALGAYIVEASERGMREAIRSLPEGRYSHAMRIDGMDSPIDLVAALEIRDGGIRIDFAGTSPMVDRGINVPLIYTQAMATFGVRCVIGGRIPNNAGSLCPIEIVASPGSILNAEYPAPVSARHVTGQMIPDVILGCLAQAVPDRVPAEGASSLWILALYSGTPGETGVDRPFGVNSFHNGGTGARPGKDGMSATAFPSGVRSGSIEVTESVAPLVVWRKAFRPGSGGDGEYRGGLGQTIEIGHVAGKPFTVSCLFDRVGHAARGRFGGTEGSTGAVRLGSGAAIPAKGRQTIPAGETVVFDMPGGGGLGDPAVRATERVETDRQAGFVA